MKRMTSYVMMGLMLLGSLPMPLQAGVVGTEQVIAEQQQGERLARLQAVLARDDVAQELTARGVDVVEARARVAAMTEQELASVASEIDNMPAGSGVVGIIGAVFVVLLVLELVGVIDIFKKI